MSQETKEAVKRQFGANAAHYVTSTVHANGSDLELLPTLCGLTGEQDLLDVATATGHTALALAPHARAVVGVDLTPAMLDQARQQAAVRGIGNVAFQEGDAEQLPFPDGAFDVVVCRIAAHHFPQAEQFCREAARVLRPGGRFVVIDNVSPEDEELDRFINEVEQLRDPSHFREHRISEWERYIARTGLTFRLAHQFSTGIELESWLSRMATPPEEAAEVRRRLAGASEAARAHFGITASGFRLHKAILVGTKGA